MIWLEDAVPEHATDAEVRDFAAAFRGFLDWIHSSAGRELNEVSTLVREFLGAEGIDHSVVTRDLPAFEHVNLQTALDVWSARDGRKVEVRGIAMPPHLAGCPCNNSWPARQCRRCG